LNVRVVIIGDDGSRFDVGGENFKRQGISSR
jgi:hypothetical protein